MIGSSNSPRLEEKSKRCGTCARTTCRSIFKSLLARICEIIPEFTGYKVHSRNEEETSRGKCTTAEKAASLYILQSQLVPTIPQSCAMMRSSQLATRHASESQFRSNEANPRPCSVIGRLWLACLARIVVECGSSALNLTMPLLPRAATDTLPLSETTTP